MEIINASPDEIVNLLKRAEALLAGIRSTGADAVALLLADICAALPAYDAGREG